MSLQPSSALAIRPHGHWALVSCAGEGMGGAPGGGFLVVVSGGAPGVGVLDA